jgi:predicted enzyme related to lactoylglutathione lyase
VIERNEYPPGVPCWVDTGQPDPDAAARFYGGVFGWELEDQMPPDAPGKYFMARLQGRDVAAIGSQMGDSGPATWTTYVCVENADETAARAKEAGGTVLQEPFDVFEAGRMAVLADPEGAVISLWQPKGTKGAQLVNEPGTWNFSELNTRDPERAKAFYGAVFGWEANEIGMGDVMLFRMPGYGDFLETLDPGTRERMAGVGAPPGFEDAVAWLAPMHSPQISDDTQPHWSITFAVDDADAAAAKAEELGGTVLVPPMDQPWVRMTVLRDPQGAVFTASKFVPPE